MSYEIFVEKKSTGRGPLNTNQGSRRFTPQRIHDNKDTNTLSEAKATPRLPVVCPGKRSPAFFWRAAAISTRGKGSLQSKEPAKTSPGLSPLLGHTKQVPSPDSSFGCQGPKEMPQELHTGSAQGAHSDKRHAGRQEGPRVCAMSRPAGAHVRATAQPSQPGQSLFSQESS